MNTYDFYLNGRLINDRILSFEYSENLDDAATSFSFDALDNYDLTENNRLNEIRVCPKGTTNVIYDGFVTDWEHTDDVNKFHYSGFDVGFYLNKNKILKQFKTPTNIGKAITDLCSEYNINRGAIPSFTQNVTKIYKDVAFADVIKELIQLEQDKGGLKDTYIDCKNGSFNILRYQTEPSIRAMIADAIFVSSHDTISKVKTTKSIQELKNKVIYTNNDEKSVYSVIADDRSSIARYGLLSTVEKVDTNKTNNLQKLAQDKLKELNKVKETYELTLLGDFRISKGKLIDFSVGQYNINGMYLIKSATHNITSKRELINISMDVYRSNS